MIYIIIVRVSKVGWFLRTTDVVPPTNAATIKTDLKKKKKVVTQLFIAYYDSIV